MSGPLKPFRPRPALNDSVKCLQIEKPTIWLHLYVNSGVKLTNPFAESFKIIVVHFGPRP